MRLRALTQTVLQMRQWDVFISHASEDKETFVEPLAIALANVGLDVWYDKFTLELGDSLSHSIDEGLANCRYGVVVISPAFLKKPWTAYELAGLVTREIAGGKKILPVWHHVTRDQVMSKSPTLADKLAVRTEDSSASEIALQILQVVRPELYERTGRGSLIARMDGTAIKQLEANLERARDELREFQCPDCGAPLVESMDIEVTERDSDTLKSFACGRRQFTYDVQDMCPSNPNFPKFEALTIQTHMNGTMWSAYIAPGGRVKLWLNPTAGRTEEEAIQALRAAYDRRAQNRYDRG